MFIFSEPLIVYKSGNPYKWWNKNKLQYPYLANMAKCYLSVPLTSVASERLYDDTEIN